MIRVRIGTHSQHGTALVQIDDLHVGLRIAHDVRDRCERILQPLDRIARIDAVRELCKTIDATVRIRGEILNCVGEDLVVADIGDDIVSGHDRRGEETNLSNSAFGAACLYVVAYLERPQHDQKRTRGKVRKQTGPRGSDRDTNRRNQRGKRRRLDTEIAENRDYEDYVQRDTEN